MATVIIDENGIRRGLKPRPIPFGHPTVAALADACAGDAPALIDAGGILSYDDVNAAVRAASSAFVQMGLSTGDRVAACCYNHNALIIAFLASQRLGLIWVGINRVLAAAEKCAQLADCGAKIFLADPVTANEIAARRHELPGLEAIRTTGPDDSLEWPGLLAKLRGCGFDAPAADPLAPAAITYTSGTTGLPKGVVHSQHNIMTFIGGGLASGRGGVWEPGLRRSVTIALTILNGMAYGPLTALASGGSFVSMDRIDSAGVAQWIERARIEALCCTPPTVRDILLKPELQDCDISSLKYVLAGGAAGAPELRQAFKARIGSEMIDEYGLTEAPAGVAGSRYDALPPPGSAGRAYPHVELVALDAQGRQLPPGTVGQIAIGARREGPWAGVFTGMLGYWRQPEESAAALQGGWICTGDLGFVGDDENLSIVGRLKDLIIRGGANIYPIEVERVLRTAPEIEDVVVTGLADHRLGEIVSCFIKLRHHADEQPALADRLARLCGAGLARYKIPEKWYIVDDIPRNAMNKPNKARLLEGPRRELIRS